jgi:hypothetical protein
MNGRVGSWSQPLRLLAARAVNRFVDLDARLAMRKRICKYSVAPVPVISRRRWRAGRVTLGRWRRVLLLARMTLKRAPKPRNIDNRTTAETNQSMKNAGYTRARQLIDAIHAADPARTAEGGAAELVYADRMESCLARFMPEAPLLLRLAARCQHLERWSMPRASLPEGKAGYLTWRRSLYTKQAERARALLLEAGVSATEAGEVATWVSKTGLKTNAGTQALEDAACLVFLENEIGAFAAQHADYPRAKFVDIVRKTWRKMSPAAQQAALGLNLPPTVADLVRDAVRG